MVIRYTNAGGGVDQATLDALDPDRHLGDLGTGGDFVTDFPAAENGDWVEVIADGTINGVAVTTGEWWQCTTDGTALGTGANWRLMKPASSNIMPATAISPASDGAVGDVGTSILYAREDHKHPRDQEVIDQRTMSGTLEGETDLGTFAGSTISDNGTVKDAIGELETALETGSGPSTDAGNNIVVGTDSKLYSPDEVVSGTVALSGVAPDGAEVGVNRSDGQLYYVNAAGVWTGIPEINEVVSSGIVAGTPAPVNAEWGVDTATGQAYYVSAGLWTAMPVVTVDINLTVSNQAGNTSGAVPLSPPVSPDTGDTHLEVYDDKLVWWVWGGTWAIGTETNASPTLDDATTASDDATGDGGSAATAARSDHKHAAQGISVDPGNTLTVGSDGLHHSFATSNVGALAISPASDDAVGTAGSAIEYARADHKHPAQGISADADNTLTIGSDGLHYASSTPANDHIFADNTTVAPAVTGEPTEAEIATFVGATVDVMVYYTGTDTSTDPLTHVYHVDQSGDVKTIERPIAGVVPTALSDERVSQVGSFITTASGVWQDTGLSITVPAGKHKLEYFVSGGMDNNAAVVAYADVRMFNVTDSVAVGDSVKRLLGGYEDDGGNTNLSGSASFGDIVDVSVDTTYRIEALRDGGNTNQHLVMFDSSLLRYSLPISTVVDPSVLTVQPLEEVEYSKTTGLALNLVYNLDNGRTWDDLVADYTYLRFNMEVDVTGVTDDVLRTITIKTADIRADTRIRFEYGSCIVDITPVAMNTGQFGLSGAVADGVGMEIVGIRSQQTVVAEALNLDSTPINYMSRAGSSNPADGFPLTLGTEFGSSGDITYSAGIFTIGTAGTYSILAELSIIKVAVSSGFFGAQIYVNGAPLGDITGIGAGNSWRGSGSISLTADFSAGDTIQLIQTNEGSFNVNKYAYVTVKQEPTATVNLAIPVSSADATVVQNLSAPATDDVISTQGLRDLFETGSTGSGEYEWNKITGVVSQWGIVSGSGGSGVVPVILPTAFDDTSYRLSLTPIAAGGNRVVSIVGISATDFSTFMSVGGTGAPATEGYHWVAIGNKT